MSDDHTTDGFIWFPTGDVPERTDAERQAILDQIVADFESLAGLAPPDDGVNPRHVPFSLAVRGAV